MEKRLVQVWDLVYGYTSSATICSHVKAYSFSYFLRSRMRTFDAWFPRYALRNRLMFFCRLFSPAVGRRSFALSTFLARRTERVEEGGIKHVIHCFADASKEACYATVDLVCKLHYTAYSNLVAAKTRLPPIKKKMTMPRFELTAARIAVRLAT